MTAKKILIIIVSFLFITQELKPQSAGSFTLQQAQQYAISNNYDLINAMTDVEIARKRVKENLAIGLPQINASAGYTDYIELPTQLIPAEFMGGDPGEFAEIQFGTQHNASWNASLNQLIFSGEYIVGVMASRAYVGLVESNRKKSEIDVKELVAKSYYPVIILSENKKVFDSTLVNLNKMLEETDAYYKIGFLEDTDVDQLQLLISDMETTITNIDNQLEISYNMLKYVMGIEASSDIIVASKLEELLAEVNREYLLSEGFNYNNHIDHIILKSQEEMAVLNMRLKRSEYYPTLSGFYQFQQDAMQNEFNFFGSDSKWYTNQMLGVQLQVPVFSSGNRKYKVQQAKLELDKIKVLDNQLKQGLELKVRTARSEFNNAYLIYQNKQLSLGNAEKIYNKTNIKYKQGLSTSLELAQTYNQYLTTQIDYLTSILDLLNKKTELEKELFNASANGN
jgi:outer membrane protein TolC